MRPFEIFRTGRQTPTSGTAIDFSAADLSAIADGYDPARHHAPIVVGHPKLDAPAYGWIDKVAVNGDRLVATPADIEPAFSELVAGGRYRKVSASFYRPDSAGNPTPGAYYLRHVGFLGAQPPAVKGLKPIEFAATEDGVLTVEFDEWAISQTAGISGRLFRRIRDWFVQEKGVDVAESLLPEWDLEALTATGIRVEPQQVPAFSEPVHPLSTERKTMPDPQPGPEAGELQRRADKLAADEAAFAERRASARATEDAGFVAGVVQAGRLPKVQEAAAVALFAELGEETVSFGEGDDARTTTPREAFRALLSALPVPVTTGELAKGQAGDLDFSDPVAVGDMIATEIQTAKGKGLDISSAQALDRLRSGAAK